MAPTLYSRLEAREDNDNGSNASTLKAVPLILNRSVSTDSVNAHEKICYANSAFCIESENDDDFDSNGDEEEEVELESVIRQTTTRIKKIDLSPEAVKKRKEVYSKWLESVNAREKEKKRLEQEKREAEIEAQRKLMEERKLQTEAKVQEWMEKKKAEADMKIARINEMRKKLEVVNNKPKELKKAINFQEWISQKNENLMKQKKHQEENKKLMKNYEKCREVASTQSYEKWVRSAPSKSKPVPMGQGLESLRGSLAKMYVNPQAWNDDWD